MDNLWGSESWGRTLHPGMGCHSEKNIQRDMLCEEDVKNAQTQTSLTRQSESGKWKIIYLPAPLSSPASEILKKEKKESQAALTQQSTHGRRWEPMQNGKSKQWWGLNQKQMLTTALLMSRSTIHLQWTQQEICPKSEPLRHTLEVKNLAAYHNMYSSNMSLETSQYATEA